METPAPTLTLAEFLLARIADDEEAAQKTIADFRYEPDDQAWLAGEMSGTPIVAVSAERALAECKAKRAIVELHDETGRSRAALDDAQGDPDLDAVMGPLRDALRAVAGVYADHRDYQPEWSKHA
ncbi:hypothetical protein GCM10022234_00860 [Aeromicrobium panaciterrae]|uniref:DUF6221 family protein n=1 Tax=Aeromicrobium panaciterrae TaxID=363861 RepID=UPI0031D5A825